MAYNQIYQQFPEIGNQWLLAFKFSSEEILSGTNRIIVVSSDEVNSLLKVFLDDSPALLVRTIIDGSATDITLTTFPFNEFNTVTYYQIFDSFLHKNIIQVRVNGAVIGTEEWKYPPPKQYTDFKLFTVNPLSNLPDTILADTYLLELP